jgi:hypothetical protein
MNTQQDELLCRYLDSQLTEVEKKQLHDLLRNSAEARKKLRMLAAISEGLAGREFLEQPKIKQAQAPLKNSIIPWLITAASLILALSGWMHIIPQEQIKAQVQTKPQSALPFIALLVDQAGAEFTNNMAPDGIRFHKGKHQLKRGIIHLRFANGADVVMRAPATFEINDSFNMRVHNGKIWAMAPPSAQGFTIATPGIDYEDLGTEFTISVNGQTGASQLDVINGQVDAKNPKSKQLISSVTEGKSLHFLEGEVSHSLYKNVESHPSPSDIGFIRWELESAHFGKEDPSLIGYYPFNESKILQNKAPHALSSNGQIHGARWVSGRWPNKRALLFDRDSDFVELSIPGEFQELTFSTWLKLDHIDYTLNSIFNSNSWDLGDVHWNIHRHGSLSLGYKGMHFTTRKSLKTIPINQWVHLAGSLSKKTGESLVYINGELAEIRSFESKNSLINPGLGRIGNWLMGNRKDKAPLRGLRGRVDEFCIWKRALNQEEIRALIEKGKPSALWSIENQ